jgi:hypothetical protein
MNGRTGCVGYVGRACGVLNKTYTGILQILGKDKVLMVDGMVVLGCGARLRCQRGWAGVEVGHVSSRPNGRPCTQKAGGICIQDGTDLALVVCGGVVVQRCTGGVSGVQVHCMC